MVMTTPNTRRDTRSSTMVKPRCVPKPGSFGLFFMTHLSLPFGKWARPRPGPFTVTVTVV